MLQKSKENNRKEQQQKQRLNCHKKIVFMECIKNDIRYLAIIKNDTKIFLLVN